MTTQAQHGTGQAGPPPDVEAILAAARRLTTHADLLESRQRQVRLELATATWTSQAAQSARRQVEGLSSVVADQVEQLRSTAEKLRAYAREVTERIDEIRRLAALPTEAALPVGTT